MSLHSFHLREHGKVCHASLYLDKQEHTYSLALFQEIGQIIDQVHLKLYRVNLYLIVPMVLSTLKINKKKISFI